MKTVVEEEFRRDETQEIRIAEAAGVWNRENPNRVPNGTDATRETYKVTAMGRRKWWIIDPLDSGGQGR